MKADWARVVAVLASGVALCAVLGVAGCARPSQANILLRKQNQELRDKLAERERIHEADVARIRGLESGASTLPTLPQQRLEQLFTTHKLRLGRLTGGYKQNESHPGDEGIKVYAVPVDGSGQDLKAAGSFVVEAYDLALPENQRVGRWEFGVDQAKQNWVGGMVYAYVLTCPWQTIPQHSDLTVKATFTDALTSRVFTVQQVLKVTPPPAPASQPATQTPNESK